MTQKPRKGDFKELKKLPEKISGGHAPGPLWKLAPSALVWEVGQYLSYRSAPGSG